jgi:polyisoprenoid-binding protein YceI
MKKIPMLCCLLLPAAAFAQPRIFDADPAASAVNFSLGDVLHSVHGTFHVRSASVDFDSATLKMSGSITVAAGSGKSGNDTRDRKMTADILDAAHFPDVTFVPTGYQGTINTQGDSTIQVSGTFTLHGAPHDITVPMQIHLDGGACTAKAQFSVPYVKWGLKDPSTFILRVGKEVQIDLSLVGSVSLAR